MLVVNATKSANKDQMCMKPVRTRVITGIKLYRKPGGAGVRRNQTVRKAYQLDRTRSERGEVLNTLT